MSIRDSGRSDDQGSRRGTLFGPQFWIECGHFSTALCDALFLVDQQRSRITGLRIRGPGRNPKEQLPPMKGVSVVAVSNQANKRVFLHSIVDHNDISDWGISAVDLTGPDVDDATSPLPPQTDPGFVRIMRNFILAAGEAVGHAVEVRRDLDVVIDADPAKPPFGKGIGLSGQRLEVRPSYSSSAPIQSPSAWVQLASAWVKLEAPRTATKICAGRVLPVSRSTITGTVSPA